MNLNEAIKHCDEIASKCEFDTDWGMGNHFIDRSGVADVIECGKEHRQLAEWLKCLAKISDMLDGTIDHLSGDDAKELLSDVKWELKLAKLTEL